MRRTVTHTMARYAPLLLFTAVAGFAVQGLAQDSVDCTRYRIAGLPCPGAPTAAATRPVVAPTVSPRASTPVNAGTGNSLAPPRTAAAPSGTATSPTGMPSSAPTLPPHMAQVSPMGPGVLPVNLAPTPTPTPTPTPLPLPLPLQTVIPVTVTVAPSAAMPTNVILSTTAPGPVNLPPAQPVPFAAPPAAKPPPKSQGSTLQPLALAPLPGPVVPREGREPGQIVVYWASAEEADSALATLLLVRHLAPTSATRLEHLGGVIAVFQLPTQALANNAREMLRQEFPAATVDFNTRYRPLLQPSAQPRMYLPQKIDLPKPGSLPQGGSGVRIGIVDGPVARTTALAGVKIIRKSFLANSEVAAPFGHATSIASLIAGQDPVVGFFGIARHASLFSAEIMRAVGADDLTNSAALIRALDWLLAEKVQIINLSLGGAGDQVMQKAFSKLATLNVILVAAAGNGGPTAAPAYPAAYPGVIAVTATDAADNLYAQANRGSYVTLAAPGVDIWVPDTELGHYVSGTSFSAAVVTAASALLLAQGTQQSNSKSTLPQRLCRGAKDLGTRGADTLFGCGLIQIGAMLRDDRS